MLLEFEILERGETTTFSLELLLIAPLILILLIEDDFSSLGFIEISLLLLNCP